MNNISTFTESILNASIRGILEAGKQIADLEQFKTVAGNEIKEFFNGETYKDERECILNGTLDQRYIIQSLVASIIIKTEKN